MKGDGDKTRLLVEKFSRQKILVLGDLMLDRYISGVVKRISPEAPVPVVRVTGEQDAPGGAANVARNINSLGGRAVLSGVIGGDQAGADLLKVLEDEGVQTEGVVSFPRVRTTVKTRVLAGRQQIVRVDRDESLDLDEHEMSCFRERALSVLKDVSGVVIEDYARGSVRQDIVTAVLAGAAGLGVPVALDPKENAELNVKGITAATPNRREVFALAGMAEREPCDNPLNDAALLEAAGILLKMWQPRFLVVTLGAQGMLLVSDGSAPRHIPTVAREVFDVSGAGDTVVAAVILGLSSGAGIDETARLANCAAGVVVGRVGTVACKAEELLQFYYSSGLDGTGGR